MRPVLFGVLCLLVSGFALVAEARIGDTEAELVQRFGAIAVRTPERVMEQGRAYAVGERLMFRPDGWRVTVVMIDGRCARIAYQKNGAWTEQDIAGWLRTNAGDWTWRELPSEVPKWQRCWQRADGVAARWTFVGGVVVEGKAYVRARTRIQEMAGGNVAPVAIVR